VWTEQELSGSTFRIRVIDAQTWQTVVDVSSPRLGAHQVVWVPTFSPDERLLAFGSRSGGAVGVLDLQTKQVLWHLGEDRWAWDIAWCPDGRSFFASDGMCRIQRYDARTGEVLWSEPMEIVPGTPLVPQLSRVYAHPQALDISPDGRYLACAVYPTCEVIVWEVASGERVKTVKAWKTPIDQALIFDWDSKGLWGAGALDTKLKYVPLDLP
jgi:WD40 repeat protein